MKKVRALVALGLSCMMFATTLVGCGSEKKDETASTSAVSEEKSDDKKEEKEEEKKENPNLPDKLENPNLTFMFWADKLELDGEYVQKKFEEKYGGKITVINATWNKQGEMLATKVASNEAPDLARGSFGSASKGLFENVDDYLDLTDPIYNQSSLEFIKNKEGKHWAAPVRVCPYLLYYDKTRFEKAGATTPLEYFEEGKWNFDTWRQAAKDVTADTNGDGKNEEFGMKRIHNWGFFPFLNGAKMVAKGDDGKWKLEFDDPNLVNGLQFYQDMVKDGTTEVDSETYESAMWWERPMWHKVMSWNFPKDHEWDFVPTPKGPGFKEGESPEPVEMWMFGIGKGCKNPKGAATFLYMFAKEWQENMGEITGYSEEQIDRIKERVDGKPVIATQYLLEPFGSRWYHYEPFLGTACEEGKAVKTVIEEERPKAQAAIDEANNGVWK